MDPLSITAAAFGFASFAGFIAEAIERIDNYKSAPKDIEHLKSRLQDLQASHESLESRHYDAEEFKKKVIAGTVGRNKPVDRFLQRYDRAFESGGLWAQAQAQLRDLIDTICRPLRKLERVLWKGRKEEIQSKITALTERINNIRHELYADDAMLGQENYLGIRNIQRQNYRSEMFQILNWISPQMNQPIDAPTLSRQSNQTVQDTFVADDPTYEQWVSDSATTNWHLHCFGKPGTGKSHRARAVVSDLVARMSQSNVPVLSIFFSEANKAQQSLRTVYCRLLRQLLSQRPIDELPEAISRLWERERFGGQAGPTELQAEEFLVSTLQEYDQKFIVVDALDEATGCLSFIQPALSALRDDAKASIFSTTRVDPTEIHQQVIVCNACRQKILDLYWVCTKCSGGLNTRFDLCKDCFQNKGITCNDSSHVMQIPRKVPIEVQPTRQEIETFVTEDLERELDTEDDDGIDDSIFIGDTPELISIRKALGHEWDLIPEKIGSYAHDNYLVAGLLLERFKAQKNVEGAKRVLAELHSTATYSFDDQYTKMLSFCLDKKESEGSKIAKSYLPLVSCALESLSFKQLSHAVVVKEGDKTHEDFEDRLYRQQTVRKATNNLLVIGDFGDSGCETVQLFHRTLADYLKGQGHDWFPEKEQLMFDACYAYLQLDIFGTPLENPEDVDKVLEDYPFASYAARFWGQHLRKISQSQHKNIVRILEVLNNPNRKLAVQLLASHVLGDQSRRLATEQTNSRTRINRDLIWDVQGNASALHICAFHGLTELCSILIADGEDVNCLEQNKRQTALHFACRNGHLRLIQVLLDAGADPNLASDHQYTPLMEAVENDRLDVFELLLSNSSVDVNADAGGATRSTALTLAVNKCRVSLVEKLLEHSDLQINKCDAFGQTALSYAVKHSLLECVSMLLRHPDINPGTKDHRGLMPLDFIAEMGSGNFPGGDDRSIVELFLRKEDVCMLNGKSLQYLIEDGRNDLVRLFLEKEIYLCWTDDHGRTLMHIAATCSGDVETLRVIYDSLSSEGFKTDSRDSYGCSPLHAACSRFDSDEGRTSTEFLLTKCKADDVMKRNANGLTPIEVAYQSVGEGQHGTVEQMFASYLAQNTNPKNPKSPSPLEKVVAAGDVNRFNAAIALKPFTIDLTPDPYTGWNALHWTLYTRRGPQPEMLKTLLPKAQSYMNKRSHSGRTCLHSAAMSGCASAVEILIDAGAELDLVDEYGDTALDLARRCPELDAAYLLIKAGAQIRRDTTKQDLLHRAILAGEDDVVEKLVAAGFDVYQRKNDTGLTALSLAKELDRRAFVAAKEKLRESGIFQTYADPAAFESAARDEPKAKAQRRIFEVVERARRLKPSTPHLHRDLSNLIERVKEHEKLSEDRSKSGSARVALDSKIPGLVAYVKNPRRIGITYRLLSPVRKLTARLWAGDDKSVATDVWTLVAVALTLLVLLMQFVQYFSGGR